MLDSNSKRPFGGLDRESRKMQRVDLEGFAHSKVKLNELFLHWLSLQSSQELITGLLNDVAEARPLPGIPSACPQSPTANSSSPTSPRSMQGANYSPPPRSPKNFRNNANRTADHELMHLGGDALRSPPLSPSVLHNRNIARQPLIDSQPEQKRGRYANAIPTFFTPKPKVISASQADMELLQLRQAIPPHGPGVDLASFGAIAQGLWRFPKFFNKTIFERLAQGGDVVTEAQLVQYWQTNLQHPDPSARAFNAIKSSDRNVLTKEDFVPFVDELMKEHPGLQFLKETPEFQERYGETVVARIFYSVNLHGNGKMTLSEMVNSNLLETMLGVDQQPDINLVNDYFSYEHFYVIYCKFWELDTDHDFLLSRDDLLRYTNHSLTYRVVERIFGGAPRALTSGVEDRMGYEDFIWFLLSEEEKGTSQAIDYWFRCLDMDGDNKLSPPDMLHFYTEQLHRMECMSQEIVSFEDILCQLTDMICPEVQAEITIKDIKACQMAPCFFNTLFNLNKFLAFEQRDPFTARQEQADDMTEWERFARHEYLRLTADEEEGEDLMDDLDGELDYSLYK